MSKYSNPEIILERNQEPKFPKAGIVIGLVLFALFLIVHNAVPFYTDWLWFREVGHTQVFTQTVIAKTILFFVYATVFFAILYPNARAAAHRLPKSAEEFLSDRFAGGTAKMIINGLNKAVFVLCIVGSLFAGRTAADNWTSGLEFLNASSFGKVDPVFGMDISFYMFRLPMIGFTHQFLVATIVLSAIAATALYALGRTADAVAGVQDHNDAARKHLLGLGCVIAILTAIGTRLTAFDLLTADNGSFTGAGYSDLHYRLFAINAQVLTLIAVAIACMVALKPTQTVRSYKMLIGTGAAWLLCFIVLGQIVPAVGQKLYVVPNQLAMDQQYIARNIEFTRLGFNVQNVTQVTSFAADESLTPTQLKANKDTLQNVRLWDQSFLGDVYSQRQTIKNFYRFQQTNFGAPESNNVDIDRYQIGGRSQQVLIAARELNQDGLTPDAQNWQNRHLGYTHGYGIAMSPVNQVIQGGPEQYFPGFSTKAAGAALGLDVSEPRIYFGKLSTEYIFVNTTQQEFNPEVAIGKGTATAYIGHGGIQVGNSPLNRLGFALRFGDQNILLASGFKPETRLMFRRDIRERVLAIAPFLQLDNDPYIVLTKEGRLVWIIDAYTVSDRFPYSSPQRVDVTQIHYLEPNYIRNSVKITVDAYDGAVNCYLADPKDPIARTYARIFPGLLKPYDQMPANLKEHVRYPEDLFRLQRAVYAAYHVDDPGVFFRREDAWAIPVEPNSEGASAPVPAPRKSPDGTEEEVPVVSRKGLMEPYYVTMRLPDLATSTLEEFLLMSPLAPLRQEDKNILGWMCARCDGEHYGELLLYRFPQQRSVAGPAQVISLINGDTDTSKELSLLRSGGSTAVFGNLLVIPIEQSLLYVAPLYVTSTNAARIPQLQRVAVVFGQRVVMDQTLEGALGRLFKDYQEAAPPTTSAPPDSKEPGQVVPPTASVKVLIETAGQQFELGQKKLKAGDFAGYGEATKQLEKTLAELRRTSGK